MTVKEKNDYTSKILFGRLEKALNKNPKSIFLIDGIGAILSAFLLGVVLVKFEVYFGIRSSILYLLASLPILFAVFDFYCYIKINDKLAVFLKIISTVNLLYCLLSIILALFSFSTITALGWVYILVEISIVIVLAVVELKLAKRLA